MKRNSLSLLLSFLTFALPLSAYCDTSLLGYNTSGTVYQIDIKTGTLTQKANEEIHSFSLGAIARRKSKIYYIAAPAGATENSIFTADTKTGTITHVDLDKSDAEDEVVALLFYGKKLFGLFYNSNTSSLIVNSINISTGVTRFVKDLTTADIEPIPGAISRIGKFLYILGKPSGNSSKRQILRYKLPSGAIKVFDLRTKGSNPTDILCDRIKLIRKSLNFLCLASPSTTQVDVYRINQGGRGTFLSTLSGITRIAGGHTMMTPDEKTFYAFVYADGETNNQRLIKLSSVGQLKANVTVNTLIVGARFGVEEPETEPES